MNCLIAGSGSIDSENLLREYAGYSELLICADGGARHFKSAGIIPHVIIGDFDSVNAAVLKEFQDRGAEIIKYPPNKDYTDVELALDYALSKNAENVFMLGATGSRLDHTLANIQLLHKLHDKGSRGVIINEKNLIYLISDNIELSQKDGYKVSLVPASETVEGVTTKGLAYPLDNAVLYKGTGLGISNEFIADKAVVSIKKGMLYVIVSRD